MNRIKRMLTVFVAVTIVGLTMTSCQRQGCPNNFSLTNLVDELVQEIIR